MTCSQTTRRVQSAKKTRLWFQFCQMEKGTVVPVASSAAKMDNQTCEEYDDGFQNMFSGSVCRHGIPCSLIFNV